MAHDEISKSFSSKWGNCRRAYFVAAAGAGYRGSVAPFRIEKDSKEPRKELRLNFSRLQPKTVLRVIGTYLMSYSGYNRHNLCLF